MLAPPTFSGKTGGSGGGGGGSGSGGNSSGGELAKTLAAAGCVEGSQQKCPPLGHSHLGLLLRRRSLESFPADFGRALSTGVVPASAVLTWLAVETNPIRKLLLYAGGGGFRERLLGDPLFLNKLAIEVGIGVCTKISAEATKRRENFWKETDFVVANVIMAIIADFMLTWLPAPTLPLAPRLGASASAAARFWAGVPDNAFQVVSAGRTFTGVQRVAAVVRNGGKLFCVGTAASFIGTGMTNGIISLRKAMDPNYAQQGEDMDLVKQSLSYGLYMSVSSNLRYQVIAGVVEQRMIEPLLHGFPLASTAASFVVRTGNTFLGSLLWIDFLRIMGLQKQKKELPASGSKKKAATSAKPQAKPAAAAKKAPVKAVQDSKKKVLKK